MSPAETLAAYFRAFDAWNVDGMLRCLDEHIEFADEISNGWGRLDGDAEIRSYTDSLGAMISSMESRLSDMREREFEGGATVTGRLHQSYVLNGEPRDYDFLFSVVFRRVSGAWKMCLAHMTTAPATPWQA